MDKLITIGLAAVFLLMTSLSSATEKCLSMHVIENTFAGYLDEKGQLAGFHLAFLNALEARTGLCMDKKLQSYARAQRGLALGMHDGGIIARTTTPDADVVYLTKLVTANTVIIPRKGLSLDGYQDLLSIRIGKVRGTSLNNRLDNDPNISIVNLSDYNQGVRLLKKGRIDALAGNDLGLSIIGRLEYNDYFNLAGKLSIGERNLWLVLSKKSAHLNDRAILKKYSQALVNEGVVTDILDHYLGDNGYLMN